MSDDTEARDLQAPLGDLDRLFDALGSQIAQRQERRIRRRAALKWGLGVIAVLGGASLAIQLRGPSDESTAETSLLESGQVLGTVGGSAVVAACPVGGTGQGTGTSDELAGVPAPSLVETPELLNRGELLQALSDEYPPDLRATEERGTTLIYFLVNETGGVAEVRLAESSGRVAFDDAAMRIAERFEFSPALADGRRVAAWVQVPITFAPERTSCPLCRRIPPPELLLGSC